MQPSPGVLGLRTSAGIRTRLQPGGRSAVWRWLPLAGVEPLPEPRVPCRPWPFQVPCRPRGSQAPAGTAGGDAGAEPAPRGVPEDFAEGEGGASGSESTCSERGGRGAWGVGFTPRPNDSFPGNGDPLGA